MQLKVCGLRQPENITEVLKLKPDLIGFIFYNRSVRFVDSEDLKAFAKGVTGVKKVGVFVDQSMEEISKAKQEYALDYAQLHGNETVEFCEKVSTIIPVIKAFQIDEHFDFPGIKKYENVCSLFLFDTKSKLYGGSGEKFNWNILQNYKGDTPFLLSGGISPEDVDDLKKFRHPSLAGYDLNSRFEDEPAIKNIEKLKNFMYEIRS